LAQIAGEIELSGLIEAAADLDSQVRGRLVVVG
jgi:hypothetical protein